LSVSEELTYLRTMNSAALSHTRIRKKGNLCLVASQNFLSDQIFLTVEAKFYTDLRDPDVIRSLFQVYVIYVKTSSYGCCEHTTMSFA